MLTFESRTPELKEMTLQHLSYSTHELEKLGSLIIWYVYGSSDGIYMWCREEKRGCCILMGAGTTITTTTASQTNGGDLLFARVQPTTPPITRVDGVWAELVSFLGNK